MPVQRGKRHKKPRRRGGAGSAFDGDTPAAVPVSRPTTPTRRRGFQTPFLVNVVLGVSMVVFGVVFTAIPQRGVGTTQKLIFLVLYFAIAGLYLRKAFQQYLAKRRGQP